jgi:hypothetical protein
METTIFVIGGFMLSLMGIGIGISIKEFNDMEDEREFPDRDFIDYDGMGNYSRYPRIRRKKNKKTKHN